MLIGAENWEGRYFLSEAVTRVKMSPTNLGRCVICRARENHGVLSGRLTLVLNAGVGFAAAGGFGVLRRIVGGLVPPTSHIAPTRSGPGSGVGGVPELRRRLQLRFSGIHRGMPVISAAVIRDFDVGRIDRDFAATHPKEATDVDDVHLNTTEASVSYVLDRADILVGRIVYLRPTI